MLEFTNVQPVMGLDRMPPNKLSSMFSVSIFAFLEGFSVNLSLCLMVILKREQCMFWEVKGIKSSGGFSP